MIEITKLIQIFDDYALTSGQHSKLLRGDNGKNKPNLLKLKLHSDSRGVFMMEYETENCLC